MKNCIALALILLSSCASRTPTIVVVQHTDSCALPEPIAPPMTIVKEAPLRSSGLRAAVYELESGTSSLPNFSSLRPMKTFEATSINVSARESHMGFPGVEQEEWFGINYTGDFVVNEPGEYRFRLTADDGAELIIDGEMLISNDGIHPPTSKEGELFLSKGLHKIQVPYFQGPRYHVALVLEVAEPGKSFSLFDTQNALGDD